jgi:uncharacterized protein (DUF433 family)
MPGTAARAGTADQNLSLSSCCTLDQSRYNRSMAGVIQPQFAANGQVVSNRSILGGRPVFAGTRVPAATLFEYLADGLSLDYFLESFPSVSRDQATAVPRYGLAQIERELS